MDSQTLFKLDELLEKRRYLINRLRQAKSIYENQVFSGMVDPQIRQNWRDSQEAVENIESEIELLMNMHQQSNREKIGRVIWEYLQKIGLPNE